MRIYPAFITDPKLYERFFDNESGDDEELVGVPNENIETDTAEAIFAGCMASPTLPGWVAEELTSPEGDCDIYVTEKGFVVQDAYDPTSYAVWDGTTWNTSAQ